MKTKNALVFLVGVMAGLCVSSAAAESKAVVKGNRVNVRGLPSLVGEVITQLKEGETITVLEEIVPKKVAAGEPAKWLKIQMPANTPVWVNAQFIDPTNKTVLARKLNVRTGAGETYNVVGVLEKDATVKDIRMIEGWLEIETPAHAYAFVAAEYLAVAATPIEAPASVPVPVEVKVEKVEIAPAMPPTTDVPPTPSPAAPPAPTPLPDPATLPAPAPSAVVAPAPLPEPTLPAPRRIVVRQGIVRSTVSIQAPTYYELVNAETRKTMNYLHCLSTNIVIKNFRGQTVMATGEEVIDVRWPNTPVLELELLQTVP
jgi:hypothetical protein